MFKDETFLIKREILDNMVRAYELQNGVIFQILPLNEFYEYEDKLCYQVTLYGVDEFGQTKYKRNGVSYDFEEMNERVKNIGGKNENDN